VGDSETAFAYNTPNFPGKCFDEVFNARWGWTIGPLAEGEYTFPVYAGAGRCDTTKGALVGQLKFNWKGTDATATYTWYEGYKMSSTHFYMGATPFPMVKKGQKVNPSIAPGQYTSIHDSLTDELEDKYVFNRVETSEEGKVYIIAHAVSHATTRRHLQANGCVCVCPTSVPTALPSESPTSAPTKPTGFEVTTNRQGPPVIKKSLPAQCEGHVAKFSGDPHMTTFDGVKYDCQGEGEFHVLKSLNSTFELQARFVKFVDDRRPTVGKSVVFNTGDGEPPIQINVPDGTVDGKCTPYVYVDGIRKEYEEVIKYGVGDDNIQVQGTQTRQGKQIGFIMYYHNSGVQLTTMAKKSSKNGCVIAAKLCLPYKYMRSQETFVGLLGTPNDDPSDDWMDKNLEKLTIPSSRDGLRFGRAYDFCVSNWCIRDRNHSLFTYESGTESYEGYSNCDQGPDFETENCVKNPPAEFLRVCGEDNDGCLIDACVSGDVADARSFVELEEDLVDKQCGKQMFFENFDGDMDSHGPFGLIKKNEKRQTKFLNLHKDTASGFTKKFDVPKNAEVVAVEFLIYEIGSWDSSGGGKDSLYVKVGGTTVDLQTFGQDDQADEFKSDIVDGISWIRESVCDSGDLGFGNQNDQIHNVKLRIPQKHFKGGVLEFSLKAEMTGDDEYCGVDNFRVVAYGQSCEIPGDTAQQRTLTNTNKMPESLPAVCEERVATAWGDPHLVTFDGIKYDCQGEGEFTLLKTMELDGNGKPFLEVQGRFASFDKRKITVTRGLAIRDDGTPTIQLNVPSRYDKHCPVDLFVGKQKRDLVEGTGIDNEVIVRQIGKSHVVVYYPKTRLQFVVKLSKSTKYGCYLSVKACLPDNYRPNDTIIGMLGTPDDNPTNEFMNADGNAYEMSTTDKYRKNYEYCTQEWCVRQASKSLFAYGVGESFQSFNKCGDQYDGSVENCVENPEDWLTEVCSLCDKRCLYEGCVGGEAEAKTAIETEFELNDERGCGQTVAFVDFVENDESDWKLIEKDPKSNNSFLGRFHSESGPASKDFEVPNWTFYLTVEFLLLEIDDWGAQDRYQNKFYVTIGGKHFHLDTFEDEDSNFHPGNYKSGFKSGIYWKRQALTRATNLGFNKDHKDQIHKVIIKVPQCYFQNGKVNIGFYVKLMDDKDVVSAGVDKLKITAHPRKCRDVHNFEKMKRKWQDHARKEQAKHAAAAQGKKKKQHGIQRNNAKVNNGGKMQKKQKKNKKNKKNMMRRALEEEDDDDEQGEEILSSMELDDSSQVECRAAFGYHSKLSQSFKKLGFTEELEYDGSDITWGWSNGPFSSSNYAYTFDVYAQGDADDSMTPVGAMSVGYDGKEAVVTLDAGEGLWLKEVQAYVGSSRLPLDEDGSETIDPDDYPIMHERMSLSRSFVVADFEDDPIYVVVEATVCGVFQKGQEKPEGGVFARLSRAARDLLI